MKFFFLALWLAALACVPSPSHAASLESGPAVEFTNGTQAVIRWTTDVSTASRVQFGESAARLTRRAEGELGAKHVVVLPALEPGTKWFFTVGTARVALATNSFTVPGALTRGRAPPAPEKTPASVKAAPVKKAPPARETWGQMASLQDHFDRHGADFRAKDPEDYARLAWEFQQRAKAEGLPTKIDEDGVVRIFDPKSGAFAAYNRNGTTKTFFKPNSRGYFDRQPGELVKPKVRN
jgi:hypothetical protein